MRQISSALLFAIAFLALSCVSGPVDIPEDQTPMELIQQAQEASYRNRYGIALQYYQAILERFPNDIDSICAAEYEIAFIHYKQGRYGEAREGFNALLERYDVPDGALLPQQFRILSNIVLERMDEIEAGGRRRGR